MCSIVVAMGRSLFSVILEGKGGVCELKLVASNSNSVVESNEPMRELYELMWQPSFSVANESDSCVVVSEVVSVITLANSEEG